MYPNPLRPGTKVCHYFAKEWQNMGYDVLVIHYRSMFPAIFTTLAGLFPKLAQKYVGNHVEMDRNMSTVFFEEDNIPVYSIPIHKYIPHGKYPRREIDKKVSEIITILSNRNFTPDAIIGHFYNPQMEIISQLKNIFPSAASCVVLHEIYSEVIKKNYPRTYRKLINSIDIIGFRSVPIKRSFEDNYGPEHKSFLCYSGVSRPYLTTPQTVAKRFSNGPLTKFIYVGQMIEQKKPFAVADALHKVYDCNGFHLTYVGKKEFIFEKVNNYVRELGIANKVEFTGQIAREEIIKYYDDAECFILVSTYEVFGLVYLEAMSRGCITIASKGEGMEGIIEHGVNGFLCEAGNSDELANIIQNINSLSAIEKMAISERAKATAIEMSDFNVAKYYIDSVMNVKRSSL